MMWWYDGNGWGWGGWAVMALMMIAFWAVVIAAGFAVVRWLSAIRNASSANGPGRAEELLAERFARGEIEEDEFRKRAALLREHR
jgi:putative membrane protein